MGRFSSSVPASGPPVSQDQVPVYNSNPYAASPGSSGMSNQMSHEDMQKAMRLQEMQRSWPTTFPKPVVGLDLDGTINEQIKGYLTDYSQMKYISGSLDAIRMIRMKGHKLMIISNQAGITKGLQTQQQVDAINSAMMQDFGNAGIFSIDGLLYSTSDFRDDLFAKPNIGMFNKARDENRINWKEGWYVGDSMSDLKAAEKSGAKPVLVLTGNGRETLDKLETFANRDLKKKTKVYNNLLEFAYTL